MRAIPTTWKFVLVLLALACMLAPASADARWRTSGTSGEFSEWEICRDGMKFALRDGDSARVRVTSLADGGVVYDQVLPLPDRPYYGDHYDTFTIRWSRPLDPTLPYPGNQVHVDTVWDGDLSVQNCYLSTATNGKIAFASERGANYDIYTMNADDQTLRQLEEPGATPPQQQQLTTHAASDVDPAWSPDGTKIAFGSNGDGNLEIYTMNADGTSPTRLTNNGTSDFSPAWGRVAHKNGAQFCKAERDFLGEGAFTAKYGGGANAYGKCVSGK
jgi:WD40 repeat protein